MIHLTRLNNHPLVVNSDMIKFIENAPDTMLTLITGEKIVICESSELVISKIIEFRQRILAGVNLQAVVTGGSTGPVMEPPELPSSEYDE